MRPRCFARFAALVTTLALYGTAFAQPQKLYVWPSPNFSLIGQEVLDASWGGGAEPFKWGIVIKTDGNLAHWGNNWFGQSGSHTGPYTEEPCLSAQHLCTLPRVGSGTGYVPRMRKVSAGWDHNLGLSDDPILWASAGLIGWGVNDKGQGSSPNWWSFDVNGVLKKTAPWNIEFNAKVVQISAGEFIDIVRFDNGQIAAWGDTTYGVHPPPLDLEPGPGQYDPYKPPAGWRFKSALAGGHYVMALILDAPGSGLRFDASTGRTGEGWITSWGSWSYGGTNPGAPKGPGFRGFAPGFVSPQNAGVNGPIAPAIWQPRYDVIVAGHVHCGGIIKEPGKYHTDQYGEIFPGTLHMWGFDKDFVISTQRTQFTFEQVAMGYSGWVSGNALMDYSVLSHPVPLFTLEGWTTPDTLPSGVGMPTGLTANLLKLVPAPDSSTYQVALCYNANCDGSTVSPVLNANDFTCFNNAYQAALFLPLEEQIRSYANCDGSLNAPILGANDFICFTNRYAVGACP